MGPRNISGLGRAKKVAGATLEIPIEGGKARVVGYCPLEQSRCKQGGGSRKIEFNKKRRPGLRRVDCEGS
jgi:hypothetical protein